MNKAIDANTNYRQFQRPIRKVVVKVGSSVIANYKMQPKTAHLASLIGQIGKLMKNDIDVVLVSSGAIVLGMGEVNRAFRPTDLASLQALAAIGQTALMRMYDDLFKKAELKCAQILLTWDDFNDRARFNNARNTLNAILEQNVVPVINENDTIATDEIKFGDNDRLSAFVASLLHADLLVLLTDVEGLYDTKTKEKKIFQEIKEITREIEGIAVGTSNKQMSKGGMTAKIDAVKIATHANIPCVIAKGETPDVLLRIVEGERLGTLFVEKEEKLLARQHWIAFGVKPKGLITVDEGAKAVLLKGGKSLLLPGVTKWEGHFKADDVVVVCDKQGQEFARGIINYSIDELFRITDKKGKREVIHCDDLVLSKS